MEKTIKRMYLCAITGKEEFYMLPESAVERFNLYVKDIESLKNKEKEGDKNNSLMYTLIEFSDAFSRYMIKL